MSRPRDYSNFLLRDTSSEFDKNIAHYAEILFYVCYFTVLQLSISDGIWCMSHVGGKFSLARTNKIEVVVFVLDAPRREKTVCVLMSIACRLQPSNTEFINILYCI